MKPPRHPGAGRGPDGPGLSAQLVGPREGKGLNTGLRRYDGWKMTTAILFLAGCASGPRPLNAAELETYPDARGMPVDVQAFIVRYQDCQHWLGEPDWDAARRRQIAEAVAQACPGIDAEARRLRTLHAGHAEVLARLHNYEALGQ